MNNEKLEALILAAKNVLLWSDPDASLLKKVAFLALEKAVDDVDDRLSESDPVEFELTPEEKRKRDIAEQQMGKISEEEKSPAPEQSDGLVEKIAIHLCCVFFIDDWSDLDEPSRECWRDHARRILAIIGRGK